ncbi:MAG: hypothetical protein KDK70_41030 [Myxococcales bacterium]|nr:hypothetical protein [Myxococcales bacterium]
MAPEASVSRASVGLLLAAALGSSACIIPDREIGLESDDDNPGAVRIVESIPLVQEFLDRCEADPRAPEYDPTVCPQVPASLPQGLLDDGPYCSCPGRDGNTLPEFSLYAEDPDRRRETAADVLYAVALLDLDPLTEAPQNFVAYPEHFVPGGRGEYMGTIRGGSGAGKLHPSVGREDNGLWRFRFGKDGGTGVDLCNDDNGETLAVGLHNLQIMVTDRPFFRPVRHDADGEPVTTDDGQPVLLPTQHGMPDLAAGATWAVANYVFRCHDPAVEDRCNCLEAPP